MPFGRSYDFKTRENYVEINKTAHLACRHADHLSCNVRVIVEIDGVFPHRTSQPSPCQPHDLVHGAALRGYAPIVLREVQPNRQPGVQVLRTSRSAPSGVGEKVERNLAGF